MTERNKNGEANGDTQLPNSKRVYVSGKIHPDVLVPFREITLAPTKSITGEVEANEPVRVYDTSGPWGDNRFDGEVEKGLPPLRAAWIRARGDVEEIAGRAVMPRDDGYLSEMHAETARRNGNSKSQAYSRFGKSTRHADLVRASENHHARNGIHRNSRKPSNRKSEG